jgi:D-glycero-beta-D-manno-heptose 1-phosphate adenylyltransferase
MRARSKIKSPHEVETLCAARRRAGARLVFTNGCFDLLHLGHIRYLEAARELGDVLVVGINSDHSVRQIKGPQRPVMSQEERSEIVAALHCVDYVTVFDTPDPLPLIQLLQPDVLVKGADWPREKVIGAELVEANGGRVELIPLEPEASSTSIIQRVMDRCAGGAKDFR